MTAPGPHLSQDAIDAEFIDYMTVVLRRFERVADRLEAIVGDSELTEGRKAPDEPRSGGLPPATEDATASPEPRP